MKDTTIHKVYVKATTGHRAHSVDPDNPDECMDDYVLYEGTRNEIEEIIETLQSLDHVSSYDAQVIKVLREEIE